MHLKKYKTDQLQCLFAHYHEHVVGAQKKHLNEMFLLSTQNMFKPMDEKIITILCSKMLSGPMSKHVDLGLTCLCLLYGPFFYFKTQLFSRQRQKSVVRICILFTVVALGLVTDETYATRNQRDSKQSFLEFYISLIMSYAEHSYADISINIHTKINNTHNKNKFKAHIFTSH